MSLVPILVLSIALLLVVMVMAGDRKKGLQVVRNIILVIGGMILLAVLFAMIGRGRS